MAVPNDSETNIDVQSEPANTEARSGGDGDIAVVETWSLCLREIALFVSFASLGSFTLVAITGHGDWKKFDKYQEYRYLVAIAILSSLYTGIQCFRQVKGKNMIQSKTAVLVDFFGDQIMAYLLISSASAAFPITNRMREGVRTSAPAFCTLNSFLAFLCLALSAIISGYKLSTQTHFQNSHRISPIS